MFHRGFTFAELGLGVPGEGPISYDSASAGAAKAPAWRVMSITAALYSHVAGLKGRCCIQVKK